MLGFLRNELLYARFVHTAASCPPIAARRVWHTLDARAAAAPAQAPILPPSGTRSLPQTARSP
jgi:hypothetical protein